MRNKKIAIASAIALAGATLGLTACGGSSGPPKGQALESQQQKNDTQSVVGNQPLPGVNWSQLRQNLIEIETAQANGVQTTSFFFNQGVADPLFVCPSIGFPIANTASLSNPEQTASGGNSQGYGLVTLPQMDPNGIYAPSGSSGTYVMCIGADGKAFAKYWEGFVDTVTGPAKWDAASHSEQMLGSSSFKFTKAKGR